MNTKLAFDEAAALRRAVHAEDFAAAEHCARRYTEALAEGARQLPRVQAVGLLKDGCALLEWARRCLCAARARCGDELRRLQRVAIYRRWPRADAVHTWRIDG